MMVSSKNVKDDEDYIFKIRVIKDYKTDNQTCIHMHYIRSFWYMDYSEMKELVVSIVPEVGTWVDLRVYWTDYDGHDIEIRNTKQLKGLVRLLYKDAANGKGPAKPPVICFRRNTETSQPKPAKISRQG